MNSVSIPSAQMADYVLTVVEPLSKRGQKRPVVVAIGGYPFVGKTTLAHELSSRWAGTAFVLPTASVIRNRASRLSLAQDGSSVESHDMHKLIAYITILRNGGSVELPTYSWLSGDFVDFQPSPTLRSDGLVIVDGSVATAMPVKHVVDVAFALRPENLNTWFDQAVARDVTERNWSREEAIVQNKSKGQTVEEQLASFGEADGQYILTVTF
jgi:uridine kinase